MSEGGRSSTFDVVIVGASFAGLSLAVALHAALGPSLRIALVDRSPLNPDGSSPDARAFAVSAGSQRMLDALGMWTEIAGEAEPVKAIDISDSGLGAAVRPFLLSYDNVTSDGAPASYIVPYPVLARALAKRVQQCAGIEIVADGVESHDVAEPFVTLSLRGGGTLRAALLVAADGGRSALREASGIGVVGWKYAQTGIVTTIAHELPHHTRAVQHFLPSGPFAILPLRGGHRSCVTWTEASSEASRVLALDDDGFRAEIELRAGGRLGAISLDGPRQSWPLSFHVARSYASRRFALIGDAAHSVHPIAGQGVNLAFRDVAALAESVADALRLGFDAGDATALERYERWRRFDSALSGAAFDGMSRLFSIDVPLVRSAREVGLGVVNRLPGLKSMFVREAAGLAGDVPRLLKGEPV